MLIGVNGSSSTLSASWTEPDPANGEISGYFIRCNSVSQFNISASSTSTTLMGLSPFTEYECVISASTGAGEGSASAPQTATTDEDGTKLVFCDL